MDDILRQRSADLKAAVAHMVAGDPDLAIASLGGDVRELPADALAETAARLWLALPPEAREGTAILAPTHELREGINAVLRHGLAEEGVLRGRSLEIMRLVDRRLTRVLAADPESYRPGDVVVANRDVYGVREGEAWTVTGSSRERVELTRKGTDGGFRPSGNASRNLSVFETRSLSLRAGDEIVFTRNLKKRKIINGERATIEKIGGKRIRIRLASGRGLSFGVDDDDLRHIDHAWSSTVHRAQGMTNDNVIAVLDASSMMSDRAMLYVEMSRARDGFVLLTDDTEQLVHRLEQEHGRAPSALEETGYESWLTPERTGANLEKEPIVPALHDWRALEEASREAGIPAFHMNGCDALMARVRRRAEHDPDMPDELKRVLADHEPFVRDRERVTNRAGRAELAAGERTRLLAEALAANTDPRNLDGYARWRRDADRAVKEGRELLGDDSRYGPHLARIGNVRERFDELERARRIDDRAAELLAAWREGGRRLDDALASGVSKLAGEARREEMPPELAVALGEYESRREAEHASERYLASLSALTDERQAFLAETGEPAAAHPGYADWRSRIETALDRAPEVSVAGFRDAVAKRTDEVRSLVRLDSDVARLHERWQRHVDEAERKGQHRFALDGAEALVSEIAAIPADALPRSMRQLAAGFGQFREDRNRVRQLVDAAAYLVERREVLLERALSTGRPLPEVPEHDAWTHEAERLVEDGRAVLSDPGRFGPHMGDAVRKTLGTEVAKLERALDIDRRAAQLLRDVGDGQPDDSLADRIRRLDAEARPGEMPPALAKALRDHEERKRAGVARRYRTFLEQCLEERQRMLAESPEPVSGTGEYRDWRQRVEAALAGLGEVEPDAGDSPLAREIREAIDQDEKAARAWSDWQAHEEAGMREDRHPLFMPGHGRLMERIEGLGPECPAVLANAFQQSQVLQRSIDRLHVVREDLQRLARTDAEIEHGDDAVRLTAGEARYLLADEGVGRAFLRHHPEIRREMTRACDRIEAGLETRDQARTMLPDWQALRAEAAKAGLHPFLMPGYGPLMERIRKHRGRLPEELARAKREHPVFEKANRRAERLAEAICSCRDRRQDLLEKAAGKLDPGEPFLNIGRKHRSWQRLAGAGHRGREGTAGKSRTAAPASGPDVRGRRGSRTHPQRRSARWIAAPPGSGLGGFHRPCGRSGRSQVLRSRLRGPLRPDARDQSGAAPRPEGSCPMKPRPAGRCGRCGTLWTGKRGRGAKLRKQREDGGPDFVGSVRYRTWRNNAEYRVKNAGTILEKDSEFQPFLARDPALRESLERNIRSLSERLEIDAPAWKEIEERRMQKSGRKWNCARPGRRTAASTSDGSGSVEQAVPERTCHELLRDPALPPPGRTGLSRIA